MTNDNCVSNNIFFGTQSWKLIGDSVIKQNLREERIDYVKAQRHETVCLELQILYEF